MVAPSHALRPVGPTDADSAAALGADLWRIAGENHAGLRAEAVALDPDGRRLRATIATRDGRRFHPSVMLTPGRDGRIAVRGGCNCMAETNCQHVAQALIAARAQGLFAATPVAGAPPGSPPGSPPGPPPGTPPTTSPAPMRRAAWRPSTPDAAAPPEAPLPWELGAWLDSLPRALEAASADYPASLRQRLIYVIDIAPDARGVPGLAIVPHTAGLRKDGSVGASSHRQSLSNWGRHELPRHARPIDRVPMARLAARERREPSPEDDPSDTLRRVLATGRARLGSASGPELHEGPAQAGRIDWQLRTDGSQLPRLVLDTPGLTAVLIPDPWYLDAQAQLLGPVLLDLPIPLASRLLAAPALAATTDVARVRAELARRVPGLALPAPHDPPPIETVTDPPRPVLRLTAGAPRTRGNRAWDTPEARAEARLGFRYGPVELQAGPDRSDAGLRSADGKLYRVRRDRRAEAAFAAILPEHGLGPRLTEGGYGWHVPDPVRFVPPADEPGAWHSILLHVLPQLRAAGWSIEIEDDFPLRLVEADDDLSAAFHDAPEEGSGIDWLELHLGVSVAGERVDLVPALVKLLEGLPDDLTAAVTGASDAATFLLPLPDGRLLALKLGQIRPILLALIELFAGGAIDPDARGLRFSRHNAAELAALEQAVPELVWQGGEALRALGRQLREAGGTIPEAAIPDSFKGTLRPYQARGVDWLQFLRAAELGGVLADDMGLGKTVQTLAHLLIEKAAGRLDRPALIVCPTSLVPNWCAEAERFAPDLRVLALHGPARKQHFDSIAAHDLVISTYPLLARDAAVLTAQPWHLLVLDEAQSIKNPLAEATRAAATLTARQRLCLSGTPLQNHLGELWSLFDFLAPGFLGSARHFRSRFRLPVEKHGDEAARARLSRRVRPFLLRRTKHEVAADLPPKTEIVEQVEMQKAQRALYDGVRLAMHKRVREAIGTRGIARSGIVILDALLKLRQACCDPRLLKLKSTRAAASAKLERLMELLPEMIEEGRRVLLFSQFTSMLDLIIPRIEAAKIPFVQLRGDTTDRRTPVQQFQAGKVPLFLLSLKAGGTGLNLTAADTVIHYDPWWNPAVEDQATDRAHRIGQDKPVFVHRLVTKDSIEEKMEALKSRKRALVDGILNAEQGGALRLTEADIEALFGA